MVAIVPNAERTETMNAKASAGVRLVFGIDLHGWEQLMLWALGFAALAAVAVVVTTAAVVVSTRDENARTQAEFEAYRLESAKQIAESQAQAEMARAEASRGSAMAADAQMRAARLNRETAQLQADNLALQTVMLPRNVGIIGINEAPRAAEYFAGVAPFAGTLLVYQVANDPEAQNLANEIAMVLSRFGWRPQQIGRQNDAIPDGVSVAYTTGKPWTKEEPNQPWFAWKNAAEALADALTKAGLAVGDRNVSRYGFQNVRQNMANNLPFFDPPLEGVLLTIGSRPISETIQWIKQGRPAAPSQSK